MQSVRDCTLGRLSCGWWRHEGETQATGNLSEYAERILTRSAELEREHGK
nr:MAG TPA: hypothetical protein [Caudoviricetes sp.]